ncbi:MAG: hypothetical protein V1816_11630 [Pseudomonadota bacterium]
MELFYGGPVDGDRRFPRPGLEKNLLRLIANGAGVKMFGLRRTGKSTLLRLVAERMAKQGYGLVEVDAEGMRSLDNLLFGVFKALSSNHDKFFDKVLCLVSSDPALPAAVKAVWELIQKGGGAPSDRNAIAEYWPLLSGHIVRSLKEDKPKLLLCLDELPFLLQNMIEDNPTSGPRQVDQMLAALREWRNAGLKMALAGSIGVAGLARKYKFRGDHLNDLSSFDPPELTDLEARVFVQAAVDHASGGKWTGRHTDAFFKELDVLYPSFLAKSLLILDHTDPPQPE